MSGRIVGEVLDYAPADLTDTEFRVLIVLAESARDADRTSRTSTRETARRARRAEGTVRNALAALACRCLIWPVHDRAKVGRGRLAQQYRIVQLAAHHRAATLTSAPPNSVTPRDDTIEPNSVTPRDDTIEPNSVTPRDDTEGLWITQRAERIASFPEPNSVIARDDTTRKDLPVTTVGSNSSKQVTVPADANSRAPSPLRSEAIGAPAAPTPWSRDNPESARRPTTPRRPPTTGGPPP